MPRRASPGHGPPAAPPSARIKAREPGGRVAPMPTAVWTGTLSFGLVAIPVRLIPATEPKDVRFHLYDREGRRVRQRRGGGGGGARAPGAGAGGGPPAGGPPPRGGAPPRR